MKKLSVFIVPLVILCIIVLFGCQKTQAPTEAPLDASALEKSEPQTLAKGKHGPAGNSNIAHLYLHEKDPDTWEIEEDGAWGKMKYNLSGSTFDFVFNGHGLDADVSYTLIYYPDPWPGTGMIALGTGTADEYGDVHIMGSVNTGDLPTEDDYNHPDNINNDPDDLDNAKIWLVVATHISGTPLQMTTWDPTNILFEYDRITFDDTDP